MEGGYWKSFGEASSARQRGPSPVERVRQMDNATRGSP